MPKNTSEGKICRLSQETESYKKAKESIEKALQDQKLEINDFSKRNLGVLYGEIMKGYTEQAKQFPDGIIGLQQALKKIYPRLTIDNDGIFGPQTIHAIVLFQCDHHLNHEYGILGCNTIAELEKSIHVPVPVEVNKITNKTNNNFTSIPPNGASKDHRPGQQSTENIFTSFISEAGGVLTREIKKFFYTHADKISLQHLQTFLTSLTPEAVKELGWGNPKKLKKILNRLKDVTVSVEDMTQIITSHFSYSNEKTDTNNLVTNETLSQDKEIIIQKRYKKLTENLNKHHQTTPEDLFAKMFVHESGGNANLSMARQFAASGTGSLGMAQAISSTFNNKILPKPFNPFDPSQAIPGAISFFLLENYDETNHKIAVQKAKIYARGQGNGRQIIQDAENGKYDIYVALDRYNKGNGGSSPNSLASMLGKEKSAHPHGNPGNYASQIMNLSIKKNS